MNQRVPNKNADLLKKISLKGTETIQPQQKNKVSNFKLKQWTKQQQVLHD